MGEEVLSLGASPRSLFLSIWAVSSHSFKAVVSSFKKFRWAVPGVGLSARAGWRPLIVGNDVWWLLFSSISWSCMFVALANLSGDPNVFKVLAVLEAVLLGGGYIVYTIVLYSVIYWHREMPFRLMGAKAKFMIEVIPMITTAALHHLLEFNYGYLALLLGFTTYFYTFAHFMHAAYDIGGIDILLVLVMQVFGYTLNVEPFV